MLPLAESLDHVGPMARRAADVAILLDAICGFDPRDTSSLDARAPRVRESLEQGVKGLRIGLDRDYSLGGVERGEAASLETALDELARAGARVVEVRMPELAGITDAWFRIVGSEALRAHSTDYPSRATEYGPFFRDFLESAARVSGAEVAQARRRQAEFASQLSVVLATVDVIACPGGDVPAPRVPRELLVGPKATLDAFWAARSEANDPPLKDTDLFMMPADLAGVPAICLPSGFSPDGLPYSVQFVARRLGEGTLCRVAHAYEQVTRWHERHPPVDAG